MIEQTTEDINKTLKNGWCIYDIDCKHIFVDGECIYCGSAWDDLVTLSDNFTTTPNSEHM